MRQSGIFRAVYEAVCEALAAEGEATGLFTLSRAGNGGKTEGYGTDRRDNAEGPAETRLRLCVCDLCQTGQDKNGQRVIAGEMSYEAPARFAITFAVRGVARSEAALLEAMGCAARFFKDNPAVSVKGYGWHGNGNADVFLEPLIRGSGPAGAGGAGDEPSLALYYRAEAGINSQKGESFRRVEKRDLRTQVK
ncbi:MAG: hypothetical protein LBQ57_09585 [Spirochaetales bacterium]|nr:hypothetical protein [Spirochaetales bacterium]